MKKLPLLILVFSVTAAPIPDLGVISPARGVWLEKESSRPDFQEFRIEVRSGTNIFKLTLTNELLRAEHMTNVPSGPGILGVQAVYSSGEVSDFALYRYDLRRAGPPKPSARPIAVLTGPEPEKSFTNEIRRVQEVNPAPPPPVPGQVGKSAESFPHHGLIAFPAPVDLDTNVPIVIKWRPLPNATNRSYSEHWDWMADRAARGMRRNQ